MTVWGNHIWITTDEWWQTEIGPGWCQLKMCHPSSPSFSLFVCSFIYLDSAPHSCRNTQLALIDGKAYCGPFLWQTPSMLILLFYRATFLIPSGIISGWEPRTGSVSQLLRMNQSKSQSINIIVNWIGIRKNCPNFFYNLHHSLFSIFVCVLGRKPHSPDPHPPYWHQLWINTGTAGTATRLNTPHTYTP